MRDPFPLDVRHPAGHSPTARPSSVPTGGRPVRRPTRFPFLFRTVILIRRYQATVAPLVPCVALFARALVQANVRRATEISSGVDWVGGIVRVSSCGTDCDTGIRGSRSPDGRRRYSYLSSGGNRFSRGWRWCSEKPSTWATGYAKNGRRCASSFSTDWTRYGNGRRGGCSCGRGSNGGNNSCTGSVNCRSCGFSTSRRRRRWTGRAASRCRTATRARATRCG